MISTTKFVLQYDDGSFYNERQGQGDLAKAKLWNTKNGPAQIARYSYFKNCKTVEVEVIINVK